jgi:hypothetical protein
MRGGQGRVAAGHSKTPDPCERPTLSNFQEACRQAPCLVRVNHPDLTDGHSPGHSTRQDTRTTRAHRLDGPPDLTCRDGTRQHPADGLSAGL